MAKRKKRTTASFVQGDVIEKLRALPDNHFGLIVTSPPYNIRKAYERSSKLGLDAYVAWLDNVIDLLSKKVKKTGSVCWQVGNYVKDGEVFPLDIYFYDSFKSRGFQLRNRIIWRFNFGLHSNRRLSGRYETILWFTKTEDYKFNLDAVRIPQLYPGKRHSKKNKRAAGKLSGNPLGKNPSDFWEFSATEQFLTHGVWDIPNVKANHPEKTIHPCQFPLELAERCVLAFTDPGDFVLDPFVGAGTSVLAAIKHGRNGVGIDKEKSFLDLARKRVRQLNKGMLKVRPIGKSIPAPNKKDQVARLPPEWSLIASANKGEYVA